jgi:hypothetical protein
MDTSIRSCDGSKHKIQEDDHDIQIIEQKSKQMDHIWGERRSILKWNAVYSYQSIVYSRPEKSETRRNWHINCVSNESRGKSELAYGLVLEWSFSS